MEEVIANPQWTKSMTLKVISMDELVVHRRCILYATTGTVGEAMIKVLGRQNATFDAGVWCLVHHAKDAEPGQTSVMVKLPA